MKPRHALLLSLTLVVVISGSWIGQAADGEVLGRITAADTGLGIEAARVSVRSGGGEEWSALSDPLGFYRVPDVSPGAHAFQATHPAYHLYEVAGLLVSEGGQVRQSAALTPLQPGEPTFDVHVMVRCATTGLELAGVPVQITVSPTGTHPAYQGRLNADATGCCTFQGVPRGFYTFRINEGADARPGWDQTVQQPMASLEGSHWATAMLKPVERTLTVAVYGYDPVSQREGAPLEGIYVIATGVHPQDEDRLLTPPQTGVSGIRKADDVYWDNTMEGKVRFAGLPPIHWRIEGKRLGYRTATRLVTTDAQAQLVPGDLRLDMTLLDTRLTAVLGSSYGKPSILAGLPVVLQGLTNSNTQGIQRTNTVVYAEVTGEATATFDKLLPGRYRLTVNGVARDTAPILIEGKPLPGEPAPNLRIRLMASEVVEAVGDRNTRADVLLATEPVPVRGRLMLTDVDHALVFENDPGARSFFAHPAARRRVEIHASEYFKDRLPAEYQRVDVETDENGEFTAMLLPGMYGLALPGLDTYTGFSAVAFASPVFGPGAISPSWSPWPQYQRWPFSVASLSDYGFLAVSSDEILSLELTAAEDCAHARYSLGFPALDPTTYQAVFLYRQNNQLKFRLTAYEDFAQGGSVRLEGGGRPALAGRKDGSVYYFENILPGAGYHFVFEHPRYRLTASSAAEVFDYEDHAPPGVIWTNAPPKYGPMPMQYAYKSGTIEYINPGEAFFTVKKWNSEKAEYEDVATQRKPDYFKAGHAGDRVFRYVKVAPSSAYESWLDLSSHFDDGAEHWYAVPCEGGNCEAIIYIGGPQAHLSEEYVREPLRVAYNLRVLARKSEGDRAYLPGVVVTFQEGGQAVSGGPALEGRTKTWDVSAATLPGWTYDYGDSIEIEMSGETPVVTLTIEMRRVFTLEGTIVNRVTGAPVPNAVIRLSRAQGHAVEELPRSGADGSFRYPYTLRREVYFLDVRARGYAPYRHRLAPDAVPAGTFVHRLKDESAVQLDPLPVPELALESVGFDRFGAFLPGVKRAGNQSVFDGFKADGPLTLTWRIRVGSPAPAEVTLARYDTATFQSGGAEAVVLDDAVAEVWIVDQRLFPNDPYRDVPQPLPLPNPANPHEGHEWLARLQANHTNTPNVFWRRVVDFEPTPDTNVVEAVGQVKLWQLPPGGFQPAFVAVSRMGAVAVHPFVYDGDYADKELTGFRLPPWMAVMADVLGVVAGAASTAEQVADLEEAFPSGLLFPMPTFSADIELLENQSLEYKYLLDVNLVDGIETPNQGVLGLALGMVGLNLNAGVEALVQGENREFYLRVKGGVGTQAREERPPKQGRVGAPEIRSRITAGSVNQDALKPKLLSRLFNIRPELKPYPKGEIAHVTSEVFDAQGRPHDLQVLHEIQGEVGGRFVLDVALSLAELAAPFPPLALFLGGAHASGNFDLDGYVGGVLGLRSRKCWRTTYPREWEHYSTIAHERQPRRHFLGGDEIDACNGQRFWDACVSFGGGFEMQVGRRLGGSVALTLAGNQCWTEEEALRLDFNTNAFWPPIRRIRGDCNLDIKAYAKLWRLKFGKDWHIEFFPIDCQFGTETQFYLSPINSAVGEIRVEDYDPALFDGRSPQILRRFMPLGTYGVAAGEPDLLVYVDMLEGRQDMALRVALRTGPESWGAPALVASTRGAFVDVAIARQPGAPGWMAVWSEIAASHVDELYPPSTLWHATLDSETGTWTTPRELAALSEVGEALTLVPFNQGLALAYLANGEGPQALNASVHATVWDGAGWTAPQPLVPLAPIRGLAVAGTTDAGRIPLHLAFVDAASDLFVVDWDGQQAGAPILLTGDADTALALTLGPEVHCLTWVARGGGLGLFRYEAGAAGWQAAGRFFPEARPASLDVAWLSHPTEPVLLHVWTEGGDKAALWHGFSSPAGEGLGPPANLTWNRRGAYAHPRILPEENREATILARFLNEPVEEVRCFTVGYPAGWIPTDRDQDQMADRGELWVVDGDPEDAIETIDDVQPGVDSDGDGFSDAQEIALGSDPVDAREYPTLQVLLVPQAACDAGAVWRLEGGSWMTSGQALPLLPGDYRIEFKDVSGWSAPRSQTVTIPPGESASLIMHYRQGGQSYAAWSALLMPPLPADRAKAEDVASPLGIANVVAYALGVHPFGASGEDLPSLRVEGFDLVYAYRVSRTALDAGYRVSMAPVLATGAWRDTDAALHVKVGETGGQELWELRFPLPPGPAQGFLRFDVLASRASDR